MSCVIQVDQMYFEYPSGQRQRLGAARAKVGARPEVQDEVDQLPQLQSRAFWIGALIVAVGLHAAVALAFALQPVPDDDLDGSPIAIDLVDPPAAPKIETPDLPIGPEAPEIAASMVAPPVAAATPPDEVVQPKVERTDRDDAELKAQDVPPEKPTQEDKPQDVAPPVEVQANAAPPSEAMAPPKLQLPVDDRASAPVSVGTLQIDERAKLTWMKSLAIHLDKNKRFPAGRKGDRGTFEVQMEFEIDETGHVVSSRILHGSGDASFDAAALAMISRASPVPVPPHDLWAQSPRFDIPVVFKAKN